ncbi:response regulator [Dyella flava]|nr:response regulator [Dyella flava]
MLVAMLLKDTLEDAGCRAVMAARLAKGLEIATFQTIDAAILDINLAGQPSFPLADVLQERGVPFVFASGYGESGVPDAYRHVPVLQKPYDMAEIQAFITTLLKEN